MTTDLKEKYTRVEHERRFLVRQDSDWKAGIEPYAKRLEDKYLRNSRLRLRVLTDSDTGTQLRKLNQKLETDSPYIHVVSRILLSPAEHALLDRLEGDRMSKTRYYHIHLGQVFSLDVFDGDLEGLVVCETEADSLDRLLNVELPAYVSHELTGDPFFEGGNLCRATRVELADALTRVAANRAETQS